MLEPSVEEIIVASTERSFMDRILDKIIDRFSVYYQHKQRKIWVRTLKQSKYVIVSISLLVLFSIFGNYIPIFSEYYNVWEIIFLSIFLITTIVSSIKIYQKAHQGLPPDIFKDNQREKYYSEYNDDIFILTFIIYEIV